MSEEDISYENDEILQRGVESGLYVFEEEGDYIVYQNQKKRRNFQNPEEPVQARAYTRLVEDYGYPPERIRHFVNVQMGSKTKEADIIVYGDDDQKSPLIVVECKKEDVSELEFKTAVDQAFSYAVAEGARFVWVTSGLKDEYYEVPSEKPKDRVSVPDVPQFGATQVANYKYAKGGGVTKNGQKLFDLEEVSQEELTRRFQQAHQALWGGGELNPSAAFDELDKLIFCKLWDERKPRSQGDPYDFQIFTEETQKKTERALYDRIENLYEEGRKQDPEVFEEGIRLSPSKVRTVVSYLESINLSDTDLDSKGRAFETFLGSFFRGDFGQYFTPRPIVQFIVDVLPIKNSSLVLDTSCGSGGFLLHALDKIRKEADEYFERGTDKHYRHWHDFAESNLYGIEINEQIARTAKMNMIIHDDGHTNVVAHDGLEPSEKVRENTSNQGFQEERFDFILTNPPFGSKVKQTERAYFNQYRLTLNKEDWLRPKSRETRRASQSTEVLFIEQCHRYLAEGGYLAIVIPDSILTNTSLQYVRDEIEEMYRVVAVVSMPKTAFSATGAGVKSSVLFLRKHAAEETERIRRAKQKLKDDIREEHELKEQLKEINAEKRRVLENLEGFENPENLEGEELKNDESYEAWRKDVLAHFREERADVRFELKKVYEERKGKEVHDYDVFMAIAKKIGYDATGSKIETNELNTITPELRRFIQQIEKNQS